ncbi:MAG: 3TM-type holin [Bdellovibrionales bacterium]
MIESILAKIGLPVLVNVISKALRDIDNPVAKGAADALENVDNALKTGGISIEQMQEANRHLEAISALQSEEYREAFKQVNESLRAEIASQDRYVRRMRPTFGYLMALTWVAQMLAVAYVIIFDTQRAGYILNAMSSLSAIWAVGLSVLGVYVYKRSEDKKLLGGAAQIPEVIFWNNSKEKN